MVAAAIKYDSPNSDVLSVMFTCDAMHINKKTYTLKFKAPHGKRITLFYILFHTVPYSFILFHTVPYCFTLFHTVSYEFTLFHDTQKLLIRL